MRYFTATNDVFQFTKKGPDLSLSYTKEKNETNMAEYLDGLTMQVDKFLAGRTLALGINVNARYDHLIDCLLVASES